MWRCRAARYSPRHSENERSERITSRNDYRLLDWRHISMYIQYMSTYYISTLYRDLLICVHHWRLRDFRACFAGQPALETALTAARESMAKSAGLKRRRMARTGRAGSDQTNRRHRPSVVVCLGACQRLLSAARPHRVTSRLLLTPFSSLSLSLFLFIFSIKKERDEKRGRERRPVSLR